MKHFCFMESGLSAISRDALSICLPLEGLRNIIKHITIIYNSRHTHRPLNAMLLRFSVCFLCFYANLDNFYDYVFVCIVCFPSRIFCISFFFF